MPQFILKLVDHQNKKVFYRVEEDPYGKDSLEHYTFSSSKLVKNGKVTQLLPYHRAVALHLDQYGRKSVEQQVVAELNYLDLKTARTMTKDIRRQMAKLDESLGYSKIK
jgi:hypothetical protein